MIENFIVTADASTNEAVYDVIGGTCQSDASTSSVQNSLSDPDIDLWDETVDNHIERAYDVKISLYPICSGFTNSAPGLRRPAENVSRIGFKREAGETA